jgi:hypothetical protein
MILSRLVEVIRQQFPRFSFTVEEVQQAMQTETIDIARVVWLIKVERQRQNFRDSITMCELRKQNKRPQKSPTLRPATYFRCRNHPQNFYD